MATLTTFQPAFHNPENIFFKLKFIWIPNEKCSQEYPKGIGLRNVCCFVSIVHNKVRSHTCLKAEDTRLRT